MRSEAHRPNVLTVYYFKTSSGGDSRSFRKDTLPTLSYKCRWSTET